MFQVYDRHVPHVTTGAETEMLPEKQISRSLLSAVIMPLGTCVGYDMNEQI